MNAAQLLHLLARYDSARTAIVEPGGRCVTYGEFEVLSRGIAHRLRDAGLKRGEVCALALQEDALHLAALFAVWRLGAILLPLDWRAAPAETEAIAARFRPRLLAATDGIRLPQSFEALRLQPPTDSPTSHAPRALPIEPAMDDVALYALSSGTTGDPKAIVISHRQHHARMIGFSISYPILREDRYMSTLPLAYSWGRSIAIAHLCLGATVILHPPMSGPEELVAAVAKQQATTVAAVPNVSRALMRLPARRGPLLPGLRRYYSGTAPLFADERAAFRARIAANLTEIYGATEVGCTCVLPPADQDLAPMSVGRPAIGIEVEVVNDDDRGLPSGAAGQIRCQGPGVAAGYLHGTVDDNRRFRNGWYYTGDFGRIDERGYLYLDGRVEDVIKRAGMTIYAAEVERVLRSHPAVAETAVVGRPSAELGEDIMAFVVLRQETDTASLADHCRLTLAAFKRPQSIEILPALPRNAAGKVVKSALPGVKACPRGSPSCSGVTSSEL